MIQSGSRLRFALESGQGLRIAGHFVGEKLEGDETMEASVFGLIHYTHATTAEPFEDTVVRNGPADHGPNLTS